MQLLLALSPSLPEARTPSLLTAPGVDILAAWSPVSPPSINFNDPRHVNWNVISGTSMSCPHASGAAAYVKSLRPNWSPAAIKSALMTTSYGMDSRKNTDAEFAYGAGHINPIKAVNPGLLFDASVADYADFLCKQGYNTSMLRLVTGDNSVCASNATGKAWSLNYPSFALSVVDGEPIYGSFYRTVTNVGYANSVYYPTITAPPSIQVTVEPSSLSFTKVGELKSFTVTVKGGAISQVPLISGSIEWKDGHHTVKTPLAVFTIIAGGYQFDSSTESKNSAFKGSTFYEKNGVLGRRQ